MAVVPKFKLVTITTAGTQLPILASSATQGNVIGATIQAHTGTIYVGDLDVDSNSGIKLTVGQSFVIPNDGHLLDLKQIYIDSASNGDKAIVVYFEKT